jgi:hypothetical protein
MTTTKAVTIKRYDGKLALRKFKLPHMNFRRSTRKRSPRSYYKQEDTSTDNDSEASVSLYDEPSDEEGTKTPYIDEVAGLLAGIMDLHSSNSDDVDDGATVNRPWCTPWSRGRRNYRQRQGINQ